MTQINLWTDELLTLSEVAAQLRRHRGTIMKWVRSGQLEAVKIGGQYATTREAVDRMVEKGDTPDGSEP